MSIVGTGPSIQAFANQVYHVLSDSTSTRLDVRWHGLEVHFSRAIQKRSTHLHAAHANPFRPTAGRFLYHRGHHLSPLPKMTVCPVHVPHSLRLSLWRAICVEGAQATSHQSLCPIFHGIYSAGMALFEVSSFDTIQVNKSVETAISFHGIFCLERRRAHFAHLHRCFE